MTALGVENEEANSLVRFSLGRESSDTEVAEVEAILPKVIQRIQRFPNARPVSAG